MRWPEQESSILHLFPARAHASRARVREAGIERLNDLSLSESSSPVSGVPTATPMQGACQAAPSGSLTAGSLTGGEADGVRYFPGQIAWLGPREQPRLATEFVSPVRVRGGPVAGFVRLAANDATWTNVGGPVANGRAP